MKNSFFAVVSLLLLFFLARYFYFKPSYSSGEVAPNVEMNIDGKDVSLQDLRGNYVLVDFWGSWCAPCIKENPALIELYNTFNGKEYKDAKGFEIVSIGIENNEGRWRSAIKKYGLNWPYHYSDFSRFKSPIAELFGVREIPSKFLINTKGEIIQVNSSIEDIGRFLQTNLK